MDPRILRAPLGDNPPEARLYYGIGVREGLRLLPDESVHTVITSPPYWSQRDYGTAPVMWGGDPDCDHVWDTNRRYQDSPIRQGDEGVGFHDAEKTKAQRWTTSEFCVTCGAWMGQLGLESHPDAFVAHLVEVFREVRRVLRPDGICWVNLGDSYAGGGKAGKNPEYQKRHKPFGKEVDPSDFGKFGVPMGVPAGLKAKDLVGIPWRFALAAQEDGWWLRSAFPWLKKNCMPESCTDRMTTAHEYWFMLTKSPKYHYDIAAGRKQHLFNRWTGSKKVDAAVLDAVHDGQAGTSSLLRAGKNLNLHPEGGRNRRTTDAWMETLDLEIAELEHDLRVLKEFKANGGLIVDHEGTPIAARSPTLPYKGAHFAVFPPPLIEPLLGMATSEKGACSQCGAPWRRQVKRPERPQVERDGKVGRNERDGGIHNEHGIERTGLSHNKYNQWLAANPPQTVGWEPSCTCDAPTRPCVVLDPFSGSGTTGMVALKMGRDYVGIDLNANYLPMAEARLLDTPPPKKAEKVEGGILDLFGD